MSALAPSVAMAADDVVTCQRPFRLVIDPCIQEMIDGVECDTLYFLDTESWNPHPVLVVTEDEWVEIKIFNRDDEPHSFEVTGVPASKVGPIPPQSEATSRFKAPEGGSYLYHDPYKAPLNRLLGLYGPLIVEPLEEGMTRSDRKSASPYSAGRHTPAITALFDTLGRIEEFRGDPWRRVRFPERDKVWIFSQTDLNLKKKLAELSTFDDLAARYLFEPTYFHINGVSGYEAERHKASKGDGSAQDRRAQIIVPEGRLGQPTLIRSMNAGLCTHSPHIHGNHVMLLSKTDADGRVVLQDNILERDTWQLGPMERVDVLLPFQKPPDIPRQKWPPVDEKIDDDHPLKYVMHCHTEMSQSAGGGNYPQGCITHWEMH